MFWFLGSAHIWRAIRLLGDILYRRKDTRVRIHNLIDIITEPFFDIFYSFKNLQWEYEYSCFPLLKINCIGCTGCANNKEPFLRQPVHPGPYKVHFSDIFCEQYEEICGKESLVQLLYETEKRNKEIDIIHAVRKLKEMKLCKDCDTFKTHGFSPACKYCEYDGNCPECGEKLKLGNDLNGPAFICSHGHLFDLKGKEWKFKNE